MFFIYIRIYSIQKIKKDCKKKHMKDLSEKERKKKCDNMVVNVKKFFRS